jgi:hypothetical protein
MRAAVPQAGLANGGDPDRGDLPAPAADSAATAGRAPVIVLATEYSGTERLRSLLDGLSGLACTSGTGILPLCEQAAAVWRIADGRSSGQPSRLAATSIRALTDSIIISVLAQTGKRRLCEFSYALPEVAETFALLYPGTRFVCLYRSCSDVIRAVLDASPWGIADPSFARFTRAYPASTAAALAAYWIAHTRSLLAFEAARPPTVLRIRYEDLAQAEQQTSRTVRYFLGVADSGFPGETALAPDSHDKPDAVRTLAKADLPAGLIPATLLAQANDLLTQLDYPVLPG